MSRDWPSTPLGECVRHRSEFIRLDDRETYLRCRVQLNGRGIVLRDRVQGVDVKTKDQQVCRAGELLVAEIDAKMGGVGIVPEDLNGSIVSSHYFLFEIDESKLHRKFLDYYVRTPGFQTQVKARGSTNYSAIRPYHVLAYTIPLPSVEEQDRIVATLDAAAARVAEAKRLCREIDEEADALLRSAFHRVADGAAHLPMSEVAPLVRRAVDVRMSGEYPELGVRSFGRGTFHKPALDFMAVGDKKLYHIEPGDVLFNNVFAWEGAIAVAQPEDAGRVGSHRFITCVADPALATPEFLAFYFLTPAGLHAIGEASPGGAGRNRTLGLEKLMPIRVPVPSIEHQRWFGEVRAKVMAVRSETMRVLVDAEAMMPAILDRAFKGELVGLGTMSKAPTVAVDGSPVAVVGATRVVEPSFAPVEGSTPIVEGSSRTVEGSSGTAEGASAAVAGVSTGGSAAGSAESARPTPSSIGQTWNIPEIAGIQAELVRRNGGSPTLGRKKISKGAYLAAALLGAKQNPPPLRKAAGPFNTQGQAEVEAYAAQAGWFRDSGSASGHRSSSRYRAGDRIAEAAAKAKGLVAARAAEFERFMGVFCTWDSDTAELHATAHAAWNGLIAVDKPVTEAAIIETFFEWSEEKAKFTKSRIRAALATLRSLGLEPNGGGPVVAGIGEESLFSGVSR